MYAYGFTVNVVIVSDHGMTTTTVEETIHVEMDDYLPLEFVEMVADRGAYFIIKVIDGYSDEVCQTWI